MTCKAYLHTLAGMFFLWQTQVISVNSLDIPCANVSQQFTLHNHQRTVQNHILTAVTKRSNYFSTYAQTDAFDCDSDSEQDCQNDIHSAPEQHGDISLNGNKSMYIDWKKPVLVAGEAGCGKSYAIRSIVNHLIENNAPVLVTALTGFLTSVFIGQIYQTRSNVKLFTLHFAFQWKAILHRQ